MQVICPKVIYSLLTDESQKKKLFQTGQFWRFHGESHHFRHLPHGENVSNGASHFDAMLLQILVSVFGPKLMHSTAALKILNGRCIIVRKVTDLAKYLLHVILYLRGLRQKCQFRKYLKNL